MISVGRIKDLRAAAAIAVLLGLTWAVPAVVSAVIPRNYPVVEQATAQVSVWDATVEFAAPHGWQILPHDSKHTASFRSPDGDNHLTVRLNSNVGDQRRFQQRQVTAFERSGVAILLGPDDRQAGEFRGVTCQVIVPRTQTSGHCAIVGHEDIAVTVLATSGDGEPALDWVALLDSLVLVDE